jgi:hypothetical protein
MSITHYITSLWEQSNNQISKRVASTGSAELNVSEAIADSSTDLEVALVIDVSVLKSIVIQSDQDITVETNSGSSPADTFTILANNPLAWNSNGPLPNPFASATDVTALFITNASGSTANLEIRALVDATP